MSITFENSINFFFKEQTTHYCNSSGDSALAKKVYHLADGRRALATVYKVALFATLLLPTIAVLDATLGNVFRWTFSKVFPSTFKTYQWSTKKITIACALIGISIFSYIQVKNLQKENKNLKNQIEQLTKTQNTHKIINFVSLCLDTWKSSSSYFGALYNLGGIFGHALISVISLSAVGLNGIHNVSKIIFGKCVLCTE
jgi:hypothetical protein